MVRLMNMVILMKVMNIRMPKRINLAFQPLIEFIL